MNTWRVILLFILFIIQFISIFGGVSWTANISEQELQLSVPQLNLVQMKSTENGNNSRELLLENIPLPFVDFNFEEKTVYLIWNREAIQKGQLELIAIQRLENHHISLKKLVSTINFPQPIQTVHKCEMQKKWFGKVTKSCMIVEEARPLNQRDLQRIDEELRRRIHDSNEFQEIIHSLLVVQLV